MRCQTLLNIAAFLTICDPAIGSPITLHTDSKTPVSTRRPVLLLGGQG